MGGEQVFGLPSLVSYELGGDCDDPLINRLIRLYGGQSEPVEVTLLAPGDAFTISLETVNAVELDPATQGLPELCFHFSGTSDGRPVSGRIWPAKERAGMITLKL